jgi:hypothetical protein
LNLTGLTFRYTDDAVKREFTVASLGGRGGAGFVFDTNAIHRGVAEGDRERTTVVLE